LTIDINIKDHWLNYRETVGVEGLHITGLPGTGKSNMASMLALFSLQKGEHVIMPGDRFCEWRHFLNYPKSCGVQVIIPSDKMCKLTYVPEELKGKYPFKEVDSYKDLNIMKYLEDKKKPQVLAVYDACFKISDRALLWVEILKQLINRITFLDDAIVILFHEAGNYWPQMARDKHWAAVDDFAELIVDCRKGLVRPILISQLDNEIEHRIRGKCMVRIMRKGWGSDKLPKPLKKAIPFTALNEYQIQYGGLYVRENKVGLFEEKKVIYKIIPGGYINGESPLPSNQEEKPFEVVIKKHNNIEKYCVIDKSTGLIVKWLSEVIV